MRQRFGCRWRLHPPAPEAAGAPLVVSHRESNARRIAALEERAEALGLKRGMGLADARAMHPGLDVVEADPGADRRLLEGLADWCDRYTPLVAIDGADGLFLDITGCAHLFGGERAMLDQLLARFFHQGFDVRAGLASTPGAAWAAARYLSGGVIMPGREAEALAPLPLPSLRLETVVRSGLESVGLRTVGAVIHAPRAPLARRFGRELLLKIDQALGRIEEAISPRLLPAALSVERSLAEPVGLAEDIERLVLALACTLEGELVRRGQGARAMQLSLFRVDGAVSRIAVRMSRPLRRPDMIRRLFHERLAAMQEGLDAGYGFDLLRLSVSSAADIQDQQTSLVETDVQSDARDLALLADRIAARLGPDKILCPRPRESHLPERAMVLEPFGTAQAQASKAGPVPGPAGWPPRPLRLFRSPEPIDVTAEVPEGPPLSFRWRRAHYQVARSEGPERIAPEWWRLDKTPVLPLQPGETAETMFVHAEAERTARLTRDYFRIEDKAGHRYWLFREGFYGLAMPPRWFVHGMFA